jgi:hypothetical protein
MAEEKRIAKREICLNRLRIVSPPEKCEVQVQYRHHGLFNRLFNKFILSRVIVVHANLVVGRDTAISATGAKHYRSRTNSEKEREEGNVFYGDQ